MIAEVLASCSARPEAAAGDPGPARGHPEDDPDRHAARRRAARTARAGRVRSRRIWTNSRGSGHRSRRSATPWPRRWRRSAPKARACAGWSTHGRRSSRRRRRASARKPAGPPISPAQATSLKDLIARMESGVASARKAADAAKAAEEQQRKAAEADAAKRPGQGRGGHLPRSGAPAARRALRRHQGPAAAAAEWAGSSRLSVSRTAMAGPRRDCRWRHGRRRSSPRPPTAGSRSPALTGLMDRS